MSSTSLKWLPWALGGAGLAAAENQYIAPDLPPELKRVNMGIGTLTGALASDPAHRFSALGSVPFKQMALFGLAGLDKFRRAQQDLVSTNLQTARTNLRSAVQNSGNSNYLKLLALAGLMGGGGMAYHAWNHRKTPAKGRFAAISDRGPSTVAHKIRIDIPPAALPKDFIPNLISADNNPRSRTQIMEKRSHVLPLIGNLAGEFSGILPLIRGAQEGGLAAGNFAEDKGQEAGRYGLSSLGNLAAGAAGLGAVTLPLLGGILKAPRLTAALQQARRLRAPAAFAGQEAPTLFPRLFPTFGSRIYNSIFRNRMGTEPLERYGGLSQLARRRTLDLHPIDIAQANLRRSRLGLSAMTPEEFANVRQGTTGLNMRSALDRARDIRFRTDPTRFAWNNPTTASPFFRKFLSSESTPTPGMMGQGFQFGRYLGNRAINAGYRGYNLARRNPNMSLFLGSMPFAGMGTARDEEERGQWRPLPSNTGIRGMPLSGNLALVSDLLGSNPNSGVVDQIRRPLSDPYSSFR